jgi:glycosyltransferase involved in cell wall biosynthesis
MRILLLALPVFSPDKRRWASRYHLEAWPFAMRSWKARRLFERYGQRTDVILQTGATFRPPGAGSKPYFLFCDSNIRVAERGSATGQSFASPLSAAEIDRVARRESTVYHGAAAIFPLSEYLRRSFIDDFGVDPDRVVAVGGGPNLDFDSIPRRLAPPSTPPTILFVGANFRRKGGDLLLQAFARVRERIPAARLIVIGSPERFEQPGVESLGFLQKANPSDLQRLQHAYEQSHVFCLPTRFEPFGIVYLEAMAYGLPCVGPDAWAVPEMIRDGKTGFTVPPENSDALADRLMYLLEHPDEGFRMGAEGRRFAETSFTWERAVGMMRSRMLAAVAASARHT